MEALNQVAVSSPAQFKPSLQNNFQHNRLISKLHLIFGLAHLRLTSIQPMIKVTNQPQPHWLQSLQQNNENANPDQRKNQPASTVDLVVVATIEQLHRVHSMKVVLYQKLVQILNGDVVKMVPHQLKVKMEKVVQNHCVRAVCLVAVNPMAKLKHKMKMRKVVQLLRQLQQQQRQQPSPKLRLNQQLKLPHLIPDLLIVMVMLVLHVKVNHSSAVRTRRHRLMVLMAKVTNFIPQYFFLSSPLLLPVIVLMEKKNSLHRLLLEFSIRLLSRQYKPSSRTWI